MAIFTQTIRNYAKSSSKGERSFLSCSSDPQNRVVDLWTSEDGSGRQKWVLVPVIPHAPNTYTVTVSGGRGNGWGVLSVTQDGSVDLFAKDDGSGRQRWYFENLDGRNFRISIAGGRGLANPSKNVLTLDASSGEIRLAERSDAKDGTQTWICEESTPPRPPSPDSKFFVGGAFEATQRDLAFDPAGWPSVAPKVGYWAHPMGVAVAKDGGWLPQLLSRFGKKEFAYEMDLLAWSDGTNPIQTNTPSCWGDWIQQADASFQCAFYAPWVAGDRLANQLDDTRNRYAQIRGKMDASGYANNGYFFYAPPCPESIANADALLNSKREGVCYVEYVTKAAGLKGICIDFPGNLYLAQTYPAQFPAGSADKCRALAKQAHDAAKKLGVPFVWCFNGGEDASIVASALDAAKKNGIIPDVAAIDNFAEATRRGTPETDQRSVAGQALAALKWFGM